MAHHTPIKVIWHPSARRESLANQILPLLMELPGVSIDNPADRDEADKIILSLEDSPGLLVAAGGDGTVHSTVNAMMNAQSKRTLAVLPLGTGNDLARSLGIPFDAASAVDVLKSGVDMPLDLLKFQTDEQSGWCTNMVTGGNTGRYLEELTDTMKEQWGVFCYLRGVIDVIQNLEAFELTIEFNEEEKERLKGLNIFLANGRTSGGGLVVSPDAKLNNGEMEVVILLDGEPMMIADLTANYLLSDFRGHELVKYRRAKRIRLESNPPLPFTGDGDSIGSSPLDLEVCSGAIHVRIPPPATSNSPAFSESQ